MADTRVRVPTNGKQVWLDRLDRDLGGHGLVSTVSEVIAVEGSPVTADQLAAALNTHTPPPEVGNEATLRSRAEQALTANTSYLALSSPTAAQTTAQVKTLTREASALIRLLLRKLDSVEGT